MSRTRQRIDRTAAAVAVMSRVTKTGRCFVSRRWLRTAALELARDTNVSVDIRPVDTGAGWWITLAAAV